MAAPKVPAMSAVTRPMSAMATDVRNGRLPRTLLVAVVFWVLYAVTLLVSRIGQPSTSDQDSAATAAQDALGTGNGIVPPNSQDQWFVPWMPVIGVVVLLLAVALLLGQGWARLVLALVGVLGVVALAAAAQWHAVVAAVFLLLGAGFSLTLSTHRYLQDRAGSGRPTTGRTTP
jgi:hypothetical protein